MREKTIATHLFHSVYSCLKSDGCHFSIFRLKLLAFVTYFIYTHTVIPISSYLVNRMSVSISKKIQVEKTKVN